MFNITGIQPLDYFIMQSAENRDKVLSKRGFGSLDMVLDLCHLDESDFTDIDWNYICRVWDN